MRMSKLPKIMQLPGGRLWHRKEDGVPGYESDCLGFSVLIGNGYVVLVSFNHEPIDSCEFWRKRFKTVNEAIDYAERM